jgi:hypothetical protein
MKRKAGPEGNQACLELIFEYQITANQNSLIIFLPKKELIKGH